MNYGLQRKFFNFIAFYELMKQLQYSRGNAAYRKKIREANLKKCMENAYQIPFYKKRFQDAGIRPEDIKTRQDLAKLPILTKDEYREWIAKEKKKEKNRLCMLAATSGSTGRPTEILNTPWEYAADIANVMRCWMVCGYRPFFDVTMTELDDSAETVGYRSFIQRLGILRREFINESDTEEKIIETINHYKPGLMHMYKSEFVRVAMYAQEHGLDICNPKFYAISGENIDGVSRRIMRDSFGDNLITIYGCVETGSIGVMKPGKNHYEIMDDLVAVNIYDKDDHITDQEGRIVFTTLYKDTFPLINYDVRDRGKMKETARGTVFTNVYGRENDEIKYRDGSSSGWIHLWYVISSEQSILQARFIQESYDEVVLQLVSKKNAEKTQQEIEESLTPGLNKVFKGRLNFRYQWLDVIPRDPNGKLRMVINNIK